MSPLPTSWWEKATTIATVVQAVVVIVSLFFINSQLQLQTKLTRAANAQTMVGLSMPVNLQAIEHPDAAKLWVKGKKGAEPTAEEVEREQYESLLATYLTFHENIFIQRQGELLDEDIYAAWNKDLEVFVREQALENYWGHMKDAYHAKFRQHVDALIARKQPPASP